ncbi:MAG: hypothetical protein MZV65_48960 [Chromatiales bacterium]|nr:hypothetical protein [Chromatiales bacterium]
MSHLRPSPNALAALLAAAFAASVAWSQPAPPPPPLPAEGSDAAAAPAGRPTRISSRRSPSSRQATAETVEEVRIGGELGLDQGHAAPRRALLPHSGPQRAAVHPPQQPRHFGQGAAVGAAVVVSSKPREPPGRPRRERGGRFPMSVYTTVSAAELGCLARPLRGGRARRAGADRLRHREHQLLRHHDEGPLRAHALRAPAADGAAVLPQPDGAPRARAAARCPAPEPDRTGALFSHRSTASRPSLVARVDGAPVAVPGAGTARAVGAALGRLHLASQRYRTRLTNRRGPAWWRQAARAVRPFLDRRAERR